MDRHRFGTWDNRQPDYTPKYQPEHHNIVPVYMPTADEISRIIESERIKGMELIQYIESPIPHGAHRLPGMLIFKKDPAPILSEEIRLVRDMIADKWYKRIIRRIKTWVKTLSIK